MNELQIKEAIFHLNELRRLFSCVANGTPTARPRRIQRKRTKGWRSPPGTIYCGCGSRYGNPHAPQNTPGADNERLVELFTEDLLNGRLWFTVDEVREKLRGRDLSCWCKPDECCHVDVLLAVANGWPIHGAEGNF